MLVGLRNQEFNYHGLTDISCGCLMSADYIHLPYSGYFSLGQIFVEVALVVLQ